MPRAIRDPIHGNIPVKDVASAVIDTLAFQRLRYVRQNGLLHFVFPGATHTRFAHSIGAMHVAGRVWDQLAQSFEPSKQRDYVGTVFELAALLHDVGHCAFSHSIESIELNNKPLLGSVKELFEGWRETQLLRDYLAATAGKAGKDDTADIGNKDVKHEQIGLILTKRIFAEEKVSSLCEISLGVDGADVGADVIALMQLGMPATRSLTEALAGLAAAPSRSSLVSAKAKDFVRDMIPVLAGLISGTLDVDRMDYLLRDSFYCGVSYGNIDIEHIIGGLGLATFKDRTYLTIKEKAVLAIDDLLWSRHQMFLQVYGHKTNVALNRTLQLALPEAMGDVQDLNPPRTYAEYLEFTDDFVLSKIFSLCFHEKRLGGKSYARLLARREVPEHLGELRLPTATSDPDSDLVRDELERLAQERAIAPSKVLFALSANDIIKKGTLPRVLVDKRVDGFELEAYRSRSSLFPLGEGEATPLPGRYAMVHFFIDRHDAQMQVTDPVGPQGTKQEISLKKTRKLPRKQAGRSKTK